MQARRKLIAGPLTGPGTPDKREEGVLNAGGRRAESVVYDFAVDGGAIGTYNFGRNLPAGAMVTAVYTDEQTAVTGATSITLKAGTTVLTTAIDFTGSSGQNKQTLASSATVIKVPTTADQQLNIAIATAAATAGRIRFFVEYMYPNDGQPV